VAGARPAMAQDPRAELMAAIAIFVGAYMAISGLARLLS
jgi:hypothetical protein